MSGENTVVPETRKLKRPVEEIRAELLVDADVKEQARLLQISVEAYVEKILDYAQHPQKQMPLQITLDGDLKAKDPKAATVAEIQDHLDKLISGEVIISRAQMRDGFSAGQGDDRYKAALASDAVLKGAPESRGGTPPPQDPQKG
ncbi:MULTISPECIES: hypothetical protein [Myxococcus]|uniref:Uncharacterized protein n=1 Tax=Myxococcus llanfairpwllgwyngyllgogerychwyrndrobwllllantysiliogogogochensis TaxID=2590453 RepID=A0A540X0K6_9BACT|nr:MULTISPECIES: hypothetical protein [Myxococcus]NTX01775.1 hypothetical protein [Myxococcus sp. CA040A]TQF14723.1 hypothetical protein FJV41_17160 [Myxococcus llanfairpwllgwyngyllgogerychwyrndrobwllllantysiliogogogochensis]